MPGTDVITEQALAAALREKKATSLSGAAAWGEPLDYNCTEPRVISRQLQFLKDLGPVQFLSQASLLVRVYF